MNIKGHGATYERRKKVSEKEKKKNLEERKRKAAEKRAHSPKGRGIQGRPNRDEQLTKEDYLEAMIKAEGKYIPAAEALGVTIQSVYNMTKKHPEIMAVRENRKRRRIEVALGVVDQMISPANKDKSTKLRASMFTLNTESEEHAEKTQTTLGGELTVRLPDIQVNFVGPKKG